MRLIATGMLCAAVSLQAVGCKQRESSPDTHNQTGTNGGQSSDKSNLAARFEAASSMNSVTLKDEALAKLATDAARAGNGEVAKKSIDAIQSVALHDDTAANSALILAKAGKGTEAVAIAQSINSVATRDDTLAKVAKGEGGE